MLECTFEANGSCVALSFLNLEKLGKRSASGPSSPRMTRVHVAVDICSRLSAWLLIPGCQSNQSFPGGGLAFFFFFPDLQFVKHYSSISSFDQDTQVLDKS